MDVVETPADVDVAKVLDPEVGPVEPPVVVEATPEGLPDVELAETDAGPVDVGVVSETGQTVVETGIVSVVKDVEWAGQLVTVLAQLMIVET